MSETQIIKVLNENDDFTISCHIQPDGDALGAVLSLGYLLKDRGKRVRLALNKGLIPDIYRFLPGIDDFDGPDETTPGVFVALDVANTARLGDFEKLLESAPTTINIDHHPDNPEFANYNWVDPRAGSTCEMIFKIWRGIGGEIGRDAAVCLYVGMLTDTGNWQYSNTKSETLRMAADLIDLGVRPNDVYKKIYESNSLGWLRLMGLGLNRAVVDRKYRLAYTVINLADFVVSGAGYDELDNMVNLLRSLADIDVSIVIKEIGSGEFRASVRSSGKVDVGAMARAFDGGGHHNASGFTSNSSPMLIITAVKKWLVEKGHTAPE